IRSEGRVSSPTVKRRKMAPTSAIEPTVSLGLTSPVACGPRMTPARISPRTPGRDICSKISPKTFAHTKMAKSSSRKRSAPWDIEHHLHVVEAPPRLQDVLTVLPDVRRQLPAKSRDSQSENYCRKPAQYFGILGSIFSAHARMPPVRF